MTTTDLIKINLMEVYRLMQSQGLKKKEACERLGFSWSTVMDWQREHPEVMQDLIEGQREIVQSNLIQLNAAYQEIVNKIVDAASKAEDIGIILMLEARLRAMVGDAKASGGQKSDQENNAASFLQGIHPVPGVSKVTRTTETIVFGEGGDIIDGEAIDQQTPLPQSIDHPQTD